MPTIRETPLAFDADELRSIAETLDKLMSDTPDLGIPKLAITGAAIAISFESDVVSPTPGVRPFRVFSVASELDAGPEEWERS